MVSERFEINQRCACEFAKRFRLKRMTVDVSPLSIRKLAMVTALPV